MTPVALIPREGLYGYRLHPSYIEVFEIGDADVDRFHPNWLQLHGTGPFMIYGHSPDDLTVESLQHLPAHERPAYVQRRHEQ